MPTLLVESCDFEGERFCVEGEDYRHFFRSLRMHQGERLRICDGHGRARWARIEEVDRRCAWIALGEVAGSNEAEVAMHLWVPPIRLERASWMVEKLTELGVAAVHWLQTERTVRGLDERGLQRLRRVSAAALRQCDRSKLPPLDGVHTFESALDQVVGADAVALDPAGLALTSVPAPEGERHLLVGPEGGWSAAELARFEAAGISRARLGNATLRVETAAVAAASYCLLV